MVFSEEDKILIKNLYVYERYSARQLVYDFPEKSWMLKSLNYLLKKLRESDSTDRKRGVADRALRACIRARGGHFEHLL